jgi:hypothetical protein
MEKGYADKINDAKLMIAGLKANEEKLYRRGLDTAFISRFEEVYLNSQTKDNEQESTKAKLKTQTEELDKMMDELEKMTMDSKKIVKMDINKSSWKEFGIDDKK